MREIGSPGQISARRFRRDFLGAARRISGERTRQPEHVDEGGQEIAGDSRELILETQRAEHHGHDHGSRAVAFRKKTEKTHLFLMKRMCVIEQSLFWPIHPNV